MISYRGRISKPPDDVPDWWNGLFMARQRRIRARIQKLMELGPMSRSQILDRCRSICEKPEVFHAIDAMVVEGTLVEEDRTVPVHYGSKVVGYCKYYHLS